MAQLLRFLLTTAGLGAALVILYLVPGLPGLLLGVVAFFSLGWLGDLAFRRLGSAAAAQADLADRVRNPPA